MSDTDRLQSLAAQDYPGLFQAADAVSVTQQRSYLRAVRTRLVLTVAAAVFAAFEFLRVGRIDLFAAGTALAFIGVMAVELSVAGNRPDKLWYESRALAESLKTLTWRYVAAAAPFDGERADEEFVERVRVLQRHTPEVPPRPSTAPAISDRMRSMRNAPLAERKQAYLTLRVRDQQDWYADKALYHQRRARTFWTWTLIMEVAGIAGALAKAVGFVEFDLAGIVAALVSALAAWNSTRQHNSTATAYVLASHELSAVREQLSHDLDEQEWSDAVADAESAISREHTMWHASRTR